MTRPGSRIGLFACLLCANLAAQVPIPWSSPAGAVNQSSLGAAMDATYVFELGVFTGTFVPTAGNTADWAANWNMADSSRYNPATSRYASVHNATGNTAPFTVGKPAYVWGRSGSQWILFRAPSWTWPDASFPSPALAPWTANAATVTTVTTVVGTINSSGSPFLMRSAAAGNTPLTWAQWQAGLLDGVAQNGLLDDPDKDGVSNLFEFAFGGVPTVPGAGPALPAALRGVAGSSYLSIRVPRPVDRAVQVSVQVSSDLAVWQEGDEFTELVENNADDFVVRDRTPLAPGNPRRFIRIALRLPAQ
ncbi:hypothetical protein HZ994_04280 [Akkermansiaceae bacterium]|nr:hypothetical protein HZ994_04280 [Akkermansiaceae bacterium]